MEVKAFKHTCVLTAEDTAEQPRARIIELLDTMQEVAGMHADLLGVGVRALMTKGLTWVLARLHVQFGDIPRTGQSVHIATWPSGRHRLLAVREFLLSNEKGGEILRASSAWALMNVTARRPARLDPHLPVFNRYPERMISDDFPALPPPQCADHEATYQAVAADIDINDHVNNLVYMDWALRSIPSAYHSMRLLALEIAFLGEARLGDEIICRTQTAAEDGAEILLQSLHNPAGNRELTRLRSRWEKQY